MWTSRCGPHPPPGTGLYEHLKIAGHSFRVSRGVVAFETVFAVEDHQAPAVGHRIAGVGGEVREAGLELRWIGGHGPDLRCELKRYLYLLAQRSEQQLGYPANQPVQGDALRPQRLPTGESQKPAGQICAAPRRLALFAR